MLSFVVGCAACLSKNVELGVVLGYACDYELYNVEVANGVPAIT